MSSILDSLMLFALTRSNLLKQLPNRSENIPRLTEIMAGSNSTTPKADKSSRDGQAGTYLWQPL